MSRLNVIKTRLLPIVMLAMLMLIAACNSGGSGPGY